MNENTQSTQPENIQATSTDETTTVENPAEENIFADTVETDATQQTAGAVEILTKERDEWKEKSYRLAAEMENLKRRTTKDVEDARKYGVTKFARELLAVQDNLERATMALQGSEVEKETLAPMLEGMKMVSDQLAKAFDSVEIKKVETVGQALNPELHQAVMQIPSEEEEGTIVQEMQAGYTIADRLLRPAMVGVATKG